jgi:16S rRNA (adenine1518-N6/adenine1519-N6)-dimethyltransferase
LGQNFLVDETTARRIVELLDPEPGRIVEIGPGRGALTGFLLERYDQVLALELDETLVAPLEGRYRGQGLELMVADALTMPLQLVAGDCGRCQVASNLPYSVGSAIVRRLMPRHDLFSKIVVMLQREVADRLVAEPGDGNHGLMALERAAWADAAIAFAVEPGAFRPVPRVWSAVVVLEPKPPAISRVRLERALAIASGALTRPRKMLRNALGPGCSESLIESANLDPSARPGTIPLDGWLQLATALDESR